MNRTVVYPHPAILLWPILSVAAVLWAMSYGISRLIAPAFHGPLFIATGALHAVVLLTQLLNYTHTYTTICPEGLLHRKGWIPNIQNSVTWPTIKDVNSSATPLEGALGCATIELLIVIREKQETLRLRFLPDAQPLFELIRSNLNQQQNQTRQISYL